MTYKNQIETAIKDGKIGKDYLMEVNMTPMEKCLEGKDQEIVKKIV